MSMRGCVEHSQSDIVAEITLPRTDNRVESRHRAAGGQQAACRVGESHPRAEPVEHVGFELHQHRRGQPDPRVTIGRSTDEVSERGRVQPAAGDVGQVARSRRGERARNPVVEERVEQRRQIGPVFGRRLAQRQTQIRRIDIAPRWLRAEAADVRDDARKRLFTHPLHFFGRQFKTGPVIRLHQFHLSPIR